MSAPSKPKYRKSNSKEYNAALKARGSLLLWLSQGFCRVVDQTAEFFRHSILTFKQDVSYLCSAIDRLLMRQNLTSYP